MLDSTPPASILNAKDNGNSNPPVFGSPELPQSYGKSTLLAKHRIPPRLFTLSFKKVSHSYLCLTFKDGKTWLFSYAGDFLLSKTLKSPKLIAGKTKRWMEVSSPDRWSLFHWAIQACEEVIAQLKMTARCIVSACRATGMHRIRKGPLSPWFRRACDPSPPLT